MGSIEEKVVRIPEDDRFSSAIARADIAAHENYIEATERVSEILSLYGNQMQSQEYSVLGGNKPFYDDRGQLILSKDGPIRRLNETYHLENGHTVVLIGQEMDYQGHYSSFIQMQITGSREHHRQISLICNQIDEILQQYSKLSKKRKSDVKDTVDA
jgi:hypothetical protein